MAASYVIDFAPGWSFGEPQLLAGHTDWLSDYETALDIVGNDLPR
jgi:hypothetical protein